MIPNTGGIKYPPQPDITIPKPKAIQIYTATISQTGTDAPIATILQNTLGYIPTWVIAATGQYNLEFIPDTLPEGITAIFMTDSTTLPTQKITALQDSPDKIKVFTNNAGTPIIGYLYNNTIEIRIYN